MADGRKVGIGTGTMGDQTGKMAVPRTDPPPIDLTELRRLAADMWSDFVFDEAALARLKRDGLDLRGARLTGPIPYVLNRSDDGTLGVTVANETEEPGRVEMLLDLWRLHFAKAMRPGGITA